jgi:hypothetical protein
MQGGSAGGRKNQPRCACERENVSWGWGWGQPQPATAGQSVTQRNSATSTLVGLGHVARVAGAARLGLVTSVGTHGSSKGIPVGILTSIKPMSHRYS